MDVDFKPAPQFSLRKSLSKSVDSLSKLMGFGASGTSSKSKRSKKEKEEKGLDSRDKAKLKSLRGPITPALDLPLGLG